MLSLPRKMLCAPIYREPDEMKEALLNKMKLLQSLQPVPWISPSTIFLKRDGLFLLKANNEGSLKVRIQKKLISMVNFFHSSIDASERQQRLHYARRRLLISVLAHAWLWGRPNVLDSQGNPIAFQDRMVLAPEDILRFLRDTRSHREGCPCEDLQGFLKTVREVPLPEDTSKWCAMGVTACLWWDKLHDSVEDIWCSCRATGGSLPPYQEAYLPSYNQACSVGRQEKEGRKNEKVMVEQESE
ncbi:hypothetical protein QL093DRAFT_2087958 [Fusarium oxysporum]|nr:hypothetical protein BKA60DRAFT_546711 [Fusarium oxysporum]KAI8402614.1 hypothetical protein FOFC_17930 [Fusarium oxysporum]KAJ9414871.1 hypothetical protein QL093DRAFT_2087958 [Fusarium oxysporum]